MFNKIKIPKFLNKNGYSLYDAQEKNKQGLCACQNCENPIFFNMRLCYDCNKEMENTMHLPCSGICLPHIMAEPQIIKNTSIIGRMQ